MTQQTPTQPQQQAMLPVSLELLNAVLGYLDTRPHSEVRRLIDAIHAEHQQFVKQQQEMSGGADGAPPGLESKPLPNGRPTVQ